MMPEKISQEQGQFSISHELVLLLEWLVMHKRDQLKSLIKKSVHQGLSEYIQHEADGVKELDQALLYYAVVDFFDTIELMLHEVMNEEREKEASKSNLLKSMRQFDSIVDKHMIHASLSKIVKQVTATPDQGTKEQLLKEVLLRWKPTKHQSNIN
jgi:hypothetical protein